MVELDNILSKKTNQTHFLNNFETSKHRYIII
jgi:hypothetical protein